MLNNSLFEIVLDNVDLYNNKNDTCSHRLSIRIKTLQQFLDYIQTESFQNTMKQLSEYVDQDRKDSLRAEIKDLEKVYTMEKIRT